MPCLPFAFRCLHAAADARAAMCRRTRGVIWFERLALVFAVLGGGGSLAAQCELDKLLPEDVRAEDRAGAAVALYGGDVFIGRPGADVPGVGAEAGVVAVYARLDPGWVEQASLVAPTGAAGDRFGEALALAGDVLIVGAPGDDSAAPEGGAAYLYERVADDWLLVARLLQPEATAGAAFGSALAVYATSVVVGAPGGDATTQAGAGAAYVYEKHGGAWMLERRLQSPAPRAGGAFGCSVTVEGPFAVVGARGDDGLPAAGPLAGAAYVFERVANVWEFKAPLFAANGAAGDGFGNSVSNYGLVVAVGAPGRDAGGTDAGAAWLFQKFGGGWLPIKQFQAPVPAAGAAYGSRVSLFKGLLAVAAPSDGASGSAAGAVHMITKVPGAWIPSVTVHASDAAARDGYGLGLMLWDDSLLVGAPGDDDGGSSAGAAYVVQPYGEAAWVNLLVGGSNAPGSMLLTGSGELCGGGSVALTLKAAPAGASVVLVAGLAQIDLPFQGGLLVPRPDFILTGLVTDAAGGIVLQSAVPTGLPTALQLFLQAWVAHEAGPDAMLGSNAVLGLTP